jgi:two-component system chemotaxis response regulator CheB
MDKSGFPVVALVCSAGGLDALTRVLSKLPEDFPAAVLVLQHLDPDAASSLAIILGRRTAITVREATEGAVFHPGVALVAPPGRHTLVTREGTIALIESGPRPPYRPSADLLLTSLALAVGNRAVAVVLSGHGIDGATGATAVHHFGGVVIASDEASSTEFSMPGATIGRDTILDHAVPLDEITALLITLTAA